MNHACIALGTNIEPRESYIQQALARIAGEGSVQIVKESPIYETAPVGYVNQARFLNLVIEVKTTLTALDLLRVCQTIEAELGRERTIRFGPRTIDLDILLYNNENKETEQLTIPHPRMHERAFVLVPLNDIAADWMVHTFDLTVSQLLGRLTREQLDGVEKLS